MADCDFCTYKWCLIVQNPVKFDASFTNSPFALPTCRGLDTFTRSCTQAIPSDLIYLQ